MMAELLARPALANPLRSLRLSALRPDWQIGWHEAHDVVFPASQPKMRLPLHLGQGRRSLVSIGGIAGRKAPPGQYEIVLIQRQRDGETGGLATVMLYGRDSL